MAKRQAALDSYFGPKPKRPTIGAVNSDSESDPDDIDTTQVAVPEVENREILTKIIKALIFLGQQAIPLYRLRDEDDEDDGRRDDGMLFNLLQFQTTWGDSSALKEYLETCGKDALYMSPSVQNQLLAICGKIIQKSTIDRANKSRAFSILADRLPDDGLENSYSYVRVLRISARFVEENKLYEHFIGFVESDVTAASDEIIDGLVQFLKDTGLDLSYWRGYELDGAFLNSYMLDDMKAQLSALYPKALFVHCAAQNLNVVLSESSSNLDVVRVVFLIKDIIAFISNVPKPEEILEEEHDGSPELQAMVDKLCATKWTDPQRSIDKFSELIPAIVEYLRAISKDSDFRMRDRVKAMNLLDVLLQFKVIVAIKIVSHLTAYTTTLSEILQSTSADLIKCHDHVKLCIDCISDKQEDQRFFEEFVFKGAVKDSVAIGILDADPKLQKIPYDEDYGYTDPTKHYRQTLHTMYRDELFAHLKLRFNDTTRRVFSVQKLIPAYFDDNVDTIKSIYELYADDVGDDTEGSFLAQYRCWKRQLQSSHVDKPKTALESMALCSTFEPAIKRVLQILACLPISAAPADLSFSNLPHLQTYLHDTRGRERTTSLALLSVYQEMDIDVDEVISIFQKESQKINA